MPDAVSALHKGCKLRGFVQGDGPPVLLIHGTGIAGRAWGPQIDALLPRFRCALFDNRGIGDSQPLGEGVTVEGMAEDALAFLDALGWESAHVVGHSLGGLIALYLAKKAKPRVRSLSLLCTFASGAVPTRLTWPMIALGTRTQIGTKAMRRRAFLEMIATPDERTDAHADRVEAAFGRGLAEPPTVTFRQIRAMGAADATPFLGDLAGIPALVLSAEHDLLAPPSAGKALSAALPGSRYVELAGAAHAVPILAPERVNGPLLDFLGNLEARAVSVSP